MSSPKRRRSSGAMYDPARDAYTVSDEQDRDHSAEHAQPGRRDAPDEARAIAPEVSQSEDRVAVTSDRGDQNTVLDSQTAIAPHSAPQQAVEGVSKSGTSTTPPPTVLPEPVAEENRIKRLSPSLPASHPVAAVSEKQGQPDVKQTMEKSSPSPRAGQSVSRHEVAEQSGAAATSPDRQASGGNGQKQDVSPNDKKRKMTEDATAEKPAAAPDRPVSKRKRQEERHQKLRRRGRTPPSVFSRRDRSPRRGNPADQNLTETPRSPSPAPRRSPTPEAQARQRKRPGGGARMGIANREVLRRRQEERERAQEEEARRALRDRGVSDVVRQHYNAVPERGREWRKTDSKIKGLRSFNNWIKSTIIQKFSPDEEFLSRVTGSKDWADGTGPPPVEEKRLLVVDLGCGKGGDLGKWQLAPQPVDLYVGLDPADISIQQARDRYEGMRSGRGQRGRRNAGPIFHAEFYPKDCFGEWLGDLQIIQQVGIDPNVGPGGSIMSSRWGGGGFDVVASMFTMHYAFESEEKTRQMLRNVAGALKKGGRFLGVGPNSDVISARVAEFHKKQKEHEATKKEGAEAPEDGEVEDFPQYPEWGNSIYRVKFPGPTPEDGVFRPPFGWKYSYFMEEAVEEIPEYVVPWEAFRALTEEYNLELQYRKPFLDIWNEEKDDPELGPLSERMGVRGRGRGPLLVSEEELEAASFYHAFCFYKV
ncbi:mRNA cap methyltransferase [Paecilomyces variotii No. 5]|uniref:mRNA cap guanine-N(7) methyltransferase n=1 Tax=Byssochlamys spectabilis (strain No. 5 / NBRC 109023) TaxID=1356009 RepID=V5I3A1_BYSSN|nr:mRNA cap methyltransferase [Paecilomyces variotii No. 5]